MNSISETVNLPDPHIQPLVHPLDLPEARADFMKAWWWEALANPAVSLCIAAILWFATSNWIAPAFAFAATLGFGWMARRWSLREAWEFIPRKRQDRNRPLPFGLAVASMLILATFLAVAIWLFILRLEGADVSPGIVEFCVGAGVAAVGLAYAVFVFQLATKRKPIRTVLLGLIPIEVSTIGTAIGIWRLLNWKLPEDLTALLVGAAIILVVGILSGAWQLADEHMRLRQVGA